MTYANLSTNVASLRMTLIFLHLPIFPYALYAWSGRGTVSGMSFRA